jgi:hypothetical protein
MSIRLMTMVWDVRWPTQNHLLVMLKLADHANDEGSKVWPAVATIAKQAQCSERTVQNVLKALRDCGLITAVKAGGGSMPTIYELNVPLLRGLAAIGAELEGGADVIEIPEETYAQALEMTGATVAPLGFAPVQPATERGATEGGRGAKLLHPNHHLEPSKETPCARSDFLNGEGKGVPRFEITPADAQWRAWLDHLRQTDPDKFADAEAAGRMTITGSKWPDKGKLVFIPSATLTQRSKAMTGDAA